MTFRLLRDLVTPFDPTVVAEFLLLLFMCPDVWQNIRCA